MGVRRVILLLQTSLIFASSATLARHFVVDVDTRVAEVDIKFLSLAIDYHILAERWKNFDFSSSRVKNMAQALSPAFLRLGGTAADLVTFKQNATTPSQPYCYVSSGFEECPALYKNRTNITMTGDDWININNFCTQVGWSFLFDVNVLKRNRHGQWSPRNAKKLLEFSARQGFANVTWELGNEPNSLKHQLGFQLSGRQLGKDFRRLRKLLDQNDMYRNAALVGPDINQLRAQSSLKKAQKALKYLKNVYKGSRTGSNKHSVLDAITWHHYYLNGHNTSLQDFLDIRHLEYLPQMIETVRSFLDKSNISKPVWLGETSSAYGGGAPGLSDKYVGAFMWLDKLGQCALHNYQVIIRQTFYHGNYAMIGEDLYPNPDFWISALYKKLVSTKVLKIDDGVRSFGATRKERFYSHCGNIKGSIVIFGMNMDNSTATISLGVSREFASFCSFVFTPESNREEGLTGRDIFLNGNKLTLNPDDSIPDLLAMKHCSEFSNSLILPPYGIGFWLLSAFSTDPLACN